MLLLPPEHPCTLAAGSYWLGCSAGRPPSGPAGPSLPSKAFEDVGLERLPEVEGCLLDLKPRPRTFRLDRTTLDKTLPAPDRAESAVSMPWRSLGSEPILHGSRDVLQKDGGRLPLHSTGLARSARQAQMVCLAAGATEPHLAAEQGREGRACGSQQAGCAPGGRGGRAAALPARAGLAAYGRGGQLLRGCAPRSAGDRPCALMERATQGRLHLLRAL